MVITNSVAAIAWNATDSGDIGDIGDMADQATIGIVGVTPEPFQPEKGMAVDPDVLITFTWTPDLPIDYWSIGSAILDPLR